MRKAILFTGIVLFLGGNLGYWLITGIGMQEPLAVIIPAFIFGVFMVVGNIVLAILGVVHLFSSRKNGKFGKEIIEVLRSLLIGVSPFIIYIVAADISMFFKIFELALVVALWYFLGRLGNTSKKEIQV